MVKSGLQAMVMPLSSDRQVYLNGGARTSRPATVQDARLKRACQEFEAVFLGMLWENMQKSVQRSSSSGMNLGVFNLLAAQGIGMKWAEVGGLGLAQVIYRSISKSSTQ